MNLLLAVEMGWELWGSTTHVKGGSILFGDFRFAYSNALDKSRVKSFISRGAFLHASENAVAAWWPKIKGFPIRPYIYT